MAELAMRAIEMVHEKDPKQVILDDLKDYLSECIVTGKDYLWIAYQREGQMKSGIWTPPSVGKEDAIQGIVGLLVQAGPTVDDAASRFPGGKVPEVGTWAVIDTRYGMQFKLGKRHCRTVQADFIHLLVSKPDIVM